MKQLGKISIQLTIQGVGKVPDRESIVALGYVQMNIITYRRSPPFKQGHLILGQNRPTFPARLKSFDPAYLGFLGPVEKTCSFYIFGFFISWPTPLFPPLPCPSLNCVLLHNSQSIVNFSRLLMKDFQLSKHTSVENHKNLPQKTSSQKEWPRSTWHRISLRDAMWNCISEALMRVEHQIFPRWYFLGISQARLTASLDGNQAEKLDCISIPCTFPHSPQALPNVSWWLRHQSRNEMSRHQIMYSRVMLWFNRHKTWFMTAYVHLCALVHLTHTVNKR